MRIVALAPCSRAASASAWAWLPEETEQTPSGRCAATALQAPRNLKAPARWRFSAFSTSDAPARASSVRERSSGVRCATPSMRAAAAWTSSIEIGSGAVAVTA
jgi:hypothetical protein